MNTEDIEVDIEGWFRFCLPGLTPQRHREFARRRFGPYPGERTPPRPGSVKRHPPETREAVRRLAAKIELTPADIARRVPSVPYKTVKDWVAKDRSMLHVERHK